MDTSLLITLAIGLLGGLLAQAVTPGKGFGLIVSIVLGLVGGWLGAMLFKGIFNFSTGIPYFNEILRSAAGAVILVLIINLLVNRGKKDTRDKTSWKS